MLHHSLTLSFSNIKSEIQHLTKSLSHSHKKHHYHHTHLNEHEQKIRVLSKRLEQLESLLKIQPQQTTGIVVTESSQTNPLDFLTDTQRIFCQKLALLQKETPGKWIPLKYLAQELYPGKDYQQIRSTISQFVSTIEDLGFVKRIRKGRQAYVLSTDKNPFLNLKKKQEQIIEAETK